nr:phage holin family protein [Providencia rettgeri]
MARMDDKDLKVGATAWGVILAISLYGGLARYIIDSKRNGYPFSWFGALSQMAVSGFTGVLGGLGALESGASMYIILFAAGMAGAMGSVALDFFWAKYTGGRKWVEK